MKKEIHKKPCTKGNKHWFGVESDYDGGVDPALKSTSYRIYNFDFCPWCGEKLEDLVEQEENPSTASFV